LAAILPIFDFSHVFTAPFLARFSFA